MKDVFYNLRNDPKMKKERRGKVTSGQEVEHMLMSMMVVRKFNAKTGSNAIRRRILVRRI